MKRLQQKIRTLRGKLQEIRNDLFFQSLPKMQKEQYYEALRLISDVEDHIIINHIMKNDKTL